MLLGTGADQGALAGRRRPLRIGGQGGGQGRLGGELRQEPRPTLGRSLAALRGKVDQLVLPVLLERGGLLRCQEQRGSIGAPALGGWDISIQRIRPSD
jgi:hypothetical protein